MGGYIKNLIVSVIFLILIIPCVNSKSLLEEYPLELKTLVVPTLPFIVGISVTYNDAPIETKIRIVNLNSNEITFLSTDDTGEGIYNLANSNKGYSMGDPIQITVCLNDDVCPETTEIYTLKGGGMIAEFKLQDDIAIITTNESTVTTPDFLDQCESDKYGAVDIYLDLNSKKRHTETNSQYQFPYFKEIDILRIDEFKIFNDGDCDITDMAISIKIKPQEGYTPTNKHPNNYGDFSIPIPDLAAGKTVYIIRNASTHYYYKMDNKTLNESYTHWGIDLDQPGDWIITSDIMDKKGRNKAISWSLIVNSNDIYWFRVHTWIETQSILLTSRTFWLNVLLAGYTAILIILGATTLISSDKQHKKIKEINVNLKKIFGKITPKKLEQTKTNEYLDKILDKISIKSKKEKKKKKFK